MFCRAYSSLQHVVLSLAKTQRMLSLNSQEKHLLLLLSYLIHILFEILHLYLSCIAQLCIHYGRNVLLSNMSQGKT